MAETFTFPPHLWRAVSSRWHLQPIQITSTNPFNAVQRAAGPLDYRWVVDMQFPAMNDETAGQVTAFLSLLDGQTNLVRLFDTVRPWPKGTGLGFDPDDASLETAWEGGVLWEGGVYWTSGEISAALGAAVARGATSIPIAGLLASQAIALATDDKMEIGRNLYRVVRAARSDASGDTRVTIRPPLRKGAASGDSVRFFRPRGVFMLAGPGEGAADYDTARIARRGCQFVEIPDLALPA